MRQTTENVSPMSNEGRNAYVIQHITDAMLELLRNKPLDDISISELVEKAGVGRASFYRNFENKEGILRAHIGEIFHEWTDQYQENDGRPLSEQIRTLFEHFEQHRALYQLLSERGLIYLLKDTMIGVMGIDPEQPALEAYARAYVAYSFYGWVEVWFQRGMKESAEEMAELFKSQGL